ncbi:MAG TPA: hypothetical protein VLK65_19255 [Vicinamibacteria bacterium]|nr:hypothetical protein [Vicinamibacteria bacterium]
MTYMKSVGLGVFAGLVGAAVWAGISYLTGYEVGWIAWGVGALVGVAVRFASKPDVSLTGDGAEDAIREIRAESNQVGPGVVAAAIAIAAVLVGKYAAVMLVIGNPSAIDFQEELLISYVADEVVAEFEAEGRNVNWPEGVDPRFAEAEADYPRDAWTEASRRWEAMSAEARSQFEEETKAAVAAMMSQESKSAWLASFSAIDLLWFGLAAWTAFKLGASGSEE